MVAIRLLDYGRVLFHGRRRCIGHRRIQNKIQVVVVDFLGRSAEIDGASRLNDVVVLVDGVCADCRRRE